MGGPPIALVGFSLVGGGPGATGTGLIIGPGDLFSFGDSFPIAKVGDEIATHGPAPHIGATVIQGSPDTFLSGIPMSHVGDACSCLCTILTGQIDASDI
jgi:hypothetical protein